MADTPTHRLTVIAISCALVLAACGSSNTPPASTNAHVSTVLVNYSACMRSHGVPSFPDPSSYQGPIAMGIDGYNFNLPANLNQQSPAYVSAGTACGHLIGFGGGSGHRVPAKAREAALAQAQCMRRHGVRNYPDPTFSDSGGAVVQRSGGPGMNPRSPAFQQAQKACARAAAP